MQTKIVSNKESESKRENYNKDLQLRCNESAKSIGKVTSEEGAISISEEERELDLE